MQIDNKTNQEKFERTEFDLFDALIALDRKDYLYYDRLTTEQQRKFVPFMMLHWMSAVKASSQIQSYYLQSVNYHANLYLFNEGIQRHPKLQWLMLCAASPGIGKQFHQWIPHIKERVSLLKEKPKHKDIRDFYKKLYPSAKEQDLKAIADSFIESHTKKQYLASKFSELKFDEIELLAELITNDDISAYEEAIGN